MKPCPAQPALRPCREQLGFPWFRFCMQNVEPCPARQGRSPFCCQRAGRRSSANCRLFRAPTVQTASRLQYIILFVIGLAWRNHRCRLVALGVSPWGPRPVGNSRDSHGLSFAERWLQNMKPCPAQPGLKPCREQLGCPMVSVLPAERGTTPSPTGLLTPSFSGQAERAVPLQAFSLLWQGPMDDLHCFLFFV